MLCGEIEQDFVIGYQPYIGPQSWCQIHVRGNLSEEELAT